MNLKELECCQAIINGYTAKLIQKVKSFTKLEESIKGKSKGQEKNKGKESSGKKPNENTGGKRQFNDIMEAARQASCIEEFQLYILYKRAKAKGQETEIWMKLAEPLNAQIDGLGEMAAQIVEEADRQNVHLKKEDVHLELLKKYTGYLMWQANVVFEKQ